MAHILWFVCGASPLHLIFVVEQTCMSEYEASHRNSLHIITPYSIPFHLFINIVCANIVAFSCALQVVCNEDAWATWQNTSLRYLKRISRRLASHSSKGLPQKKPRKEQHRYSIYYGIRRTFSMMPSWKNAFVHRIDGTPIWVKYLYNIGGW